MDIKELKKKSKNLEPILRIGKNGINETVILEIKKHLKKRGLIKIRFLNSVLEKVEKRKMIEEIVEKTSSRLIEQVGNVMTIYKEKGRKSFYRE